MKNFILPVLALLLAVPFASASNMKMVAYFPVPYAAYNDVSVTGTLDLGIINTCGLDCGNKLEVLKSNTSRPLDTGRFIVRNGTLNLDSSKSDSQVKGLSFQAGNGNITSKAVFEFKHDLNVNSLPTLQSTEATNAAYLTSLKLFPSKITSGNLFPKCEVSEISWKKLKVGDTEEAFLVCGTGEMLTPSCEAGQSAWEDFTVENPSERPEGVDDCDGNDMMPYECPVSGVSEARTCTDIYYTDPSGSFSYGEESTTDYPYDSCDGDINNKFYCGDSSRSSCSDVYGPPVWADMTRVEHYYFCSSSYPGGFAVAPGEVCLMRDNRLPSSIEECCGKSAYEGGCSYRQNCFFPDNSYCNGQQYREGLNRGYQITCLDRPKYKQREVTCEKPRYKKRQVACCPS